MAATPAYWLDASRLANQSSSVSAVTQPPASNEQPASSPDLSPSADDSETPPRSVVASAGDVLPQSVARAEEPQRTAPVPRPALKTSIV
ncbi:MAG: hypothetical protein WBZ27_21745, partial [Pseudolabrys sp.]